MATNKQTGLAPRDPFAALRHEFDRIFDESAWPVFRWPSLRPRAQGEEISWFPQIDVVEKDGRVVTRVDLPGVKKEDVRVEVADGHLTIAGERKSEAEEKKENFYRCERQYGSFYRTVPLPDGVKLDDVKATFADGVLEVSVPVPAAPESKVRKVEIQEAPKSAKPAA